MTVTEQELQEAMKQGFEAGLAAGRAEALAQTEVPDRLDLFEKKLNDQSKVFERGIEINEEIVVNIQDEVNLLWSMLELPWRKRLRRLSRGHALKLRQKENGRG